MSLLRSAPDGLTAIGWKRLAKAMVVVWLLPAAIAAIALAGQWLADTRAMGNGALAIWLGTVLMLLSPLLSWFGLVLAAPIVAALMNRGWFGWLPALATGLAVGGVVAVLMQNELALSFGVAMMLMLRAILGWRYPQSF